MKLNTCALYCSDFEPTVFFPFTIFYLLIYSIRNQQLSFKICHILHYPQVCILRGISKRKATFMQASKGTVNVGFSYLLTIATYESFIDMFYL